MIIKQRIMSLQILYSLLLYKHIKEEKLKIDALPGHVILTYWTLTSIAQTREAILFSIVLGFKERYTIYFL